MNKYLIHKKIRTPIHLYEGFEYMDYRFIPINDPIAQGPKSGFIVQKKIEANDFKSAYKKFILGIMPILNIASVITQCVVHSLASTSHFIYRLNDNNSSTFFFYYADETDPVGMGINKEGVEDLKKIYEDTDTKNLAAFEYLREANNAHTALSFMAMLIIAAESLSGTSKTKGKCEHCSHEYEYPSVNKEKLKEILGRDSYREIYTSKLRHKLFHGGKVDDSIVAKIAEKTYSQIIHGYLKQKFALNSVNPIVQAPRGFSIEYLGTFVKPEQKGIPDLLKLDKNHDRLIYTDEPKNY